MSAAADAPIGITNLEEVISECRKAQTTLLKLWEVHDGPLVAMSRDQLATLDEFTAPNLLDALAALSNAIDAAEDEQAKPTAKVVILPPEEPTL